MNGEVSRKTTQVSENLGGGGSIFFSLVALGPGVGRIRKPLRGSAGGSRQ